MRVGINTALMASGGGYRQTGVSRYIGELVGALEPLVGPRDSLVRLQPAPGPLRDSPSARIAWEQTVLPISARRHRLDVLHSPVNITPQAWRGPSVVTVHDLAFLHHPEHVTTRRRAWLTAAIRRSVRGADQVIAVSRSTADDLLVWSGIDPDRVTVVHQAASPRIRTISAESVATFRERHGLDRPYVLAVGTLEPRKNLPLLLTAFARIVHDVPHDLVLVGPEGWLNGELRRTVQRLGLGHRLRMSGFVPDEELGSWYSAADLFAFPSLYEGFGLPSVEAMHCGAPVVASNSSCFPEVVGDAGVLLPPHDVEAWAAALRDLLGDPVERKRLSVLGRTRAETFTWARAAAATYDVYRTTAR